MIKDVLKDSNVDELEGTNGNFVDLLKQIQEDGTVVIRILISACNIKLSSFKTKKELQLYTSITSVEDQELRALKLLILDTIGSYSYSSWNFFKSSVSSTEIFL